jgi:hypothetical protein
MNPLRLFIAAGAAAVMMGAAAPGFAMTGDCFWTHLAPATRGAFLANYARMGADALDRVAVSSDEYAAMDSACGAADSSAATEDRLLGAVVIEHGSAVFLEGRLHWDAAAIDAAWGHISSDDMDWLHDQARQVLRGQSDGTADVTNIAKAFLGDAAAADPGVLDQARAYITSRAMREEIEQQTAPRAD